MISPRFNGTPSTEEYRAYLALLLPRSLHRHSRNGSPLPRGRTHPRPRRHRTHGRAQLRQLPNGRLRPHRRSCRDAKTASSPSDVKSPQAAPAAFPLLRRPDLPHHDRRAHAQGLRCRYSRRTVRTHRIPRPARILRPPQRKVKLAPGKPGQFVRRRGEDVVTGQVLARAGERVTPLCSVRSHPRAMPA